MTSRSTCFTSYNATPPVVGEGINYMIYQQEVCPTTGKLHWQGYAQHKMMRMKAFQTAIGDEKAHCERTRGTALQARDYCRKDETRVPDTEPQEFGDFITQGTGLALAQATRLVNEGKWRDVDDTTWARHYKGLQAVMDKNYIPPIKRAMQVHVVWGISGASKTTGSLIKARALDPHACVISWFTAKDGASSMSGDAGRARFDPYKGQRAVVIDEFRAGQISIEEFLSMTGGAPMTARVLGGVIDWKATDIWITSNDHPRTWFAEGMSARFARRLTSITEITQAWRPGGADDLDRAPAAPAPVVRAEKKTEAALLPPSAEELAALDELLGGLE